MNEKKYSEWIEKSSENEVEGEKEILKKGWKEQNETSKTLMVFQNCYSTL